jgi:signal transduction histidine kinase/CheY-like chemotaxis protein
LSGKVWRGEIINKRKDGSLYTEEMTIAPVRDDRGEITHFVAVKQDISDRKLLQEQFLQSQKLESIGQLAGGVAHDYNNILSVIIGYAHLLKRKFKGDSENDKPLDAILAAARRAASLTEQLLVFARKEMISPKIININSSIESIEKMLQRIIGENINLVFHPGRDVRNIKIDPSQFDQVLVNLATNSRDAIKGIGTIAIETMNVSIDEDYVKNHAGLTVGEFVRLSFTDTGMGMDEETVKRIFEPFFTTKEKGQGTGLGLSTVYGIVKQNNGYIYATSKPGEGTTFEIYLPPSYEEVDRMLDQSSEISVLGTETILVVEDQVDILELTKASLEKSGFCVLTAIEPNEALRLCETYDGTIHLLLTDVIMPVMSGKSLRERVKKLRPRIKTLFMSGYTANELSPEGVLAEGIDFIQKPFTPAELAKKVSEVLRA